MRLITMGARNLRWLWLAGPGGLVALLVLVFSMAVLGIGAGAGSGASTGGAGAGGSCSGGGAVATVTTSSASAAAGTVDPSALAAAQSAAISAAVASATGSALPPSRAAAAAAAGGYDLNARQVQAAQLIVAVGKALNLDERGMAIALAASYNDAVLQMDADVAEVRFGLFAARVQDNPGADLYDPVAATTAFYRHLSASTAYRNPATDLGQVAVQVQNSTAGAGDYAKRETWARALVAILDVGPAAAAAVPGTASVDCITGTVLAPVPGFTAAQVHNAQVIVAAAQAKGLGLDAASIGVAVAIAESTLINFANDGNSSDLGQFGDGHRPLNADERAVARQSLNYPHEGVAHNLDSIGLFQQRPSAGWGTPAELIDPATSAGKFYDALVKVSGWGQMQPATAAQTVQGSPDSDGGIYAAAYDQAHIIVTAITAPSGAGAGGAGAVVVDGPTITLPGKAGVAGAITAPNAAVAKVISAGLSWLGEPYSYAGGSPAGPTTGECETGAPHVAVGSAWNDCNIVGFDCSGLMLYMWAQAGITLPRNSQDQLGSGQQIPYEQALPGDMIGYTGHITMFIGKVGGVDYMLEAPQSGEFVHVTPVRGGHYATVSRVWAGLPKAAA